MKNELSDELVITRLIERVESGNTFILEQIGKTIKEIGELTPTKAYQLQQMIKYGSRYDTIIERLSKITNLNTKEIDEIFEEYAKRDYRFAEKFYKYRNITYVPFNEMTALKNEVDALSLMTKGTYMNLANASVLGFWLNDRFYNIQEAYQYAIDQAILSISQGKNTYQHQMYSLLKQFGDSGVRTIDYASGTSRRVDSALRMNLREGIRELHNATQDVLGKEFGANMIEVSHHSNSAPDHIDTIDGKQFAMIDVIREQIAKGIEKEIKLEDIEDNCVKVKGKWYDDFDTINNSLQRKVSTLNCYHSIFTGILGINKPQFTEKELYEDREKNLKGFDFEGKHLTMYEGTQLQRRIETEIRKQKDNQILGVSSGNKELIADAQYKITALTNRYRELSKISGLPTKMERMRVVGYKRVNTKNFKNI